MIDFKTADELFRYDKKTGFLHWKVNRASNARVGDRAGCFDKYCGYIKVCINNKRYNAHRIIRLLTNGKLPEKMVDHIDQVKTNNKPDNIRDADHKINGRNVARLSVNTSGMTGVRWNKAQRRWVSYIKVDGRRSHLGCFKDKFEAACARKSAERKHGFHINHGNERAA